MRSILLLSCFFCFLISCTQPTDNQSTKVEDTQKVKLDSAFTQLFEEVIVVKLHAYAAIHQDSLENYPYTGKKIDKAFYQYFEEELLKNTEQGFYACYKDRTGFYILRAPSKTFANEIILCLPDESTGKLKKVAVLANRWCSKDKCHQQDGWLTDLDLDNELELVTNTREWRPEGALISAQFQVKMQERPGLFTPGKHKLANESSYVMVKL